jgi:predicted nucleic acid-binding protein
MAPEHFRVVSTVASQVPIKSGRVWNKSIRIVNEKNQVITTRVMAVRRNRPVWAAWSAERGAAISIITLGEFAEGFADLRALLGFLAPFRVVTVSRAIAWRTAAVQSSLSQRLGENDAWIAATALSYEATLVGREKAFERVPRLDYLSF